MVRATWQLSLGIAATLAAVHVLLGLVARRRGGTLTGARLFTREFAVVLTVVALWQYLGRFVHTRVEGAVERARDLAALEHALGLPGEQSVQALVLPHAWLVRALDAYYSGVHFSSMLLLLAWLWWRHREHYRPVRDVALGSTLVCLALQAVPVAPPRLTPGLGFVDTALRYGESVYGAGGSGAANQLAAMPSVHVLWATIVAVTVVRASRARGRWVVAAHLPLTVLVVVATANHWWLDGVVAVAVLGAVAGARVVLVGGPLLWVSGRGTGSSPAPRPTPVR